MDRPKPELNFKVTEAPFGSSYHSGELHDVSSGMRTYRPVIDQSKCVKCLQCFLYCPDGTIDKSGEQLEIDYNYCKGCGVCAKMCKLGAITMIKEAEA